MQIELSVLTLQELIFFVNVRIVQRGFEFWGLGNSKTNTIPLFLELEKTIKGLGTEQRVVR